MHATGTSASLFSTEQGYARPITFIAGIVFLALGIIGFFNNPIFGVFATDTLLNIVYLVTGILAIGFALPDEVSAKGFDKVAGIVYAVIALLGIFTPGNSVIGIMASNAADIWFQAIVAIVLLYLGFVSAVAPERIERTGAKAESATASPTTTSTTSRSRL